MYQKIREHGGWHNWNFEIVKICNCINQYDAQIKTNEYKYSLQTNINSNIQINNPNINQINLDTNLDTNLQCETTEELDIIESLRFICQTCNYKTNKKSSFNAHMLSNKHKKMIEFATIVPKYICKQCSKGFNDRAGLWRHNKKCNMSTDPTPTTTNVSTDPTPTTDQTAHLTNLVMKVLEQNQELTKQIIELSKQSSVTNNTINNNNNNNNNFR